MNTTPFTDEQFQTALLQYIQWRTAPSLGKRRDLREANLSNADLRYTNLANADLRYTDLQGTDLQGADLRGTDLRGAILQGANLQDTKLKDVIGDGTIIRSAQFEEYLVVSCDDWLQIGCQGHKIPEWLAFSDSEIASMARGALDWWKKYKDAVLTFCNYQPTID